jgi:hypothetical protein
MNIKYYRSGLFAIAFLLFMLVQNVVMATNAIYPLGKRWFSVL